MLRTRVLIAAALLAAGLHATSAQTATAPAGDAKPSKTKLTMQKLKEMKATWAKNKPRLKACRKEVKAKGLAGDDRWFFIQDCMNKT